MRYTKRFNRLKVKRMSYDADQNYMMVVDMQNESHIIKTQSIYRMLTHDNCIEIVWEEQL